MEGLLFKLPERMWMMFFSDEQISLGTGFRSDTRTRTSTHVGGKRWGHSAEFPVEAEGPRSLVLGLKWAREEPILPGTLL